MKFKNWITCVQDRGKWKEVVEKAKTFNQEVQRLEEEEEEEEGEEEEEEEEEEEYLIYPKNSYSFPHIKLPLTHINRLAPEFYISILAHPVCKM